MTDHARRIDEIDRTLLTRAPTALDFALLLAERKRLYESLYPESRRGGDRRSAEFQTKRKTISFRSDAAARLGLTERAINLAIALAESLDDELVELLRGTLLADNAAALRQLMTFGSRDRRTVINTIRSGEVKSFGKALVLAGLRRERDEQEALFQLVAGRLDAMSPRTLRRLAELITTEISKRERNARTTSKAARKAA